MLATFAITNLMGVKPENIINTLNFPSYIFNSIIKKIRVIVKKNSSSNGNLIIFPFLVKNIRLNKSNSIINKIE